MSDDKKPWEKPWNPQEIAENASNWSFAADLSLLKYLEVFSEDLLGRAETIDDNVNTLLNNLSKASLSLDIAKNKFLSLSNTQFIESRVYEDDETLLSNEDEVEKEEPVKNNTEEFNKNEMRLAALRGIEVLEEFFDKVEVVDSDSEEDNDFTSFVLRPKDTYMNRPLPYVIGSEKWHKTLHVGLEDSSSESENEKVIENYSDTDSESDLPITNRSQAKSISGSGSSEADFSNKLDHPVANSTLNDTNKQEDFLGSSQDYNSISAQAPMSQSSFAEQLAAKLGNVINNTVEEPPINTKPIRKMNSSDIYKNFFSDEPPPLDDMSEEFSPKSKDQGIFSGGDGLFDDLNDDEPFWGTSVKEKPKAVSNVPAKPVEDLFEDEDSLSNSRKDVPKSSASDKLRKELEGKLSKKKESSIFDEDSESDDDSLFGKPLATSKKSVNASKESQNLFADENKVPSSSAQNKKESRKLFSKDTLFNNKDNNTEEEKDPSLMDEEVSTVNNESSRRKAPVGGIKVISNPNLFAGQNIKKILKNRPQSSSESDDESPPSDEIESNRNIVQNISKENSKKIEDKNEEIIAKSTVKSDKSNNIFDDVDIDDDLFKDDLFSNFSAKKKSTNLFGKSEGLFDEFEESDDESITDRKNTEDISKKGEEKSKKSDAIFDKNEENLKKDREHLVEERQSHIAEENVSRSKATQSIFSADEESDSDDLFSSKHSKIISKNEIIEDFSSIKKSESKKTLQPNPSLAKTTKITEKKAPSLFDDDEDAEDELFSSNFLAAKKPTPTVRSIRPEQKAPLPRRKNLFDEDVVDDDAIFSESKSSNRDKNIFGGDDLEKTTLSKSDKSVEDLVKVPVRVSSANSQGSNVFERDELKKNAPKNLFNPLQESRAISDEDSLFKDEELEEENLFGNANKISVNEKPSKSVESISEEKLIKGKSVRNIEINEESIVSSHENPLKIAEDSSKEKEYNKEIIEDTSSGFKKEDFKSEIVDGNNQLSFNKNEDISNDNASSQKYSILDHEESKQRDEKNAEEVQEKNIETQLNDEIPSINVKISKEPERSEAQHLNFEANNEENQNNSSTMENMSIKNKFSSTVVGRIPSLNIFDPDPPSDPEDWDDRSEPNIFGDDLYSFDNTDNFGENRSSIFDREPPSPAFNESSGIVRDHRSRLDTDVSSFYPYASSSRRLSNEVMSEEQSGDSLFYTKNRHSIEPNIPPSISESAEFSVSNLDITPSGKLEDLYSESSDQSKPVKSVTFEDALDKKMVDDVFETSAGIKLLEEVSPDRTLEDDRDEFSKGNSKPIVSKKPELKKLEMPEEVGESKEDGSSPGKLKHNLNINVFALLPGAGKSSKREASVIPKPPEREILGIPKPSEREAVVVPRPQKREAPPIPKPQKREAPPIPRLPQRSLSLDLDLDDHTDGTYEKPSPRELKITPDTKATPEKIQNNLDNVEVLESITKSRARGPVKRRPSTKRGRDAIRNSCIDFTFASDPTNEINENEEKESTETDTTEKKSFKNELTAKLVQNSRSTARQMSFPPLEKTPLKTTVLQQQHIKTNETRTVNDPNLTRSQEIFPSETTISPKPSPTTEDIPKISIETPCTTEQTNTTADDAKSHDNLTNLEESSKFETNSEYAPKFVETSTSRIRRIDLIDQSKSRHNSRENKSLFQSEINSEDVRKVRSETTSRGLRNMDFFRDLMADNQDDPFKSDESSKTKDLFPKLEDEDTVSETSVPSNRLKRIDFLNDLMSEEFNIGKNYENKSDKNETTSTVIKASEKTENVTESRVETSERHNIFEKSKITTSSAKNSEDVFKKREETSKVRPRKLNLFGDDFDDDDDLFSNTKNKKKENATSNFLSVDSGGDSGLFDVTRRSSFVKTDNFASPEFIKDNLSEDEENEDIFSEKKLPPKSDIFKPSSFVYDDEDDEDLLGQACNDKKKASTTTTISTRRLKVSGLKKLENVTVTGDDPLSALEK